MSGNEVHIERVSLFREPVEDFLEVGGGFPFVHACAKEVVFDFFGIILVVLIDVVGWFECVVSHFVFLITVFFVLRET